MKTLPILLLAGFCTGCSPENDAEPSHAAGAAAHAGRAQSEAVAHVDSARSNAENVARFRAGLPRVTELEHAAPSRDELVHRFLDALAQHDTAALARLHLDRAEFAYLYYPFTIYTHPPYEQAPQLTWMLLTQSSQKGLRRLLQRVAGTALELHRYACAGTEPQDLNTLHTGCELTLKGNGTPVRLFGTIIERAGRFKFVSYTNDL